ncbi:TIGR02444 family protein [Salinicola sp. DM10]|uniref:TIGR02444 family protein n=1 Tax=Salinicola sp. DM10 TaxID=2815721 RepID=UPI001A90B2B0|nr:TIGR02444 family protein [Salinicola sp. DM10]MCE3027746.1 TIGR02444 family protein [Salinicola sp. DM10]
MTTADAADDLWDFALARYARPGAQARCLSLQDDHGYDVCELLWLAWLAEHGREPSPDATQGLAEVRHWQETMTRPLRQRRRELKAALETRPRLSELRQRLQQAELLAERETLIRLAELPSRRAASSEPPAYYDPLAAAQALCAAWATPTRAAAQPTTDLGTTSPAYATLQPLLTLWLAATPDAEPNPSC